jgi:retron-type reverse transcriptase
LIDLQKAYDSVDREILWKLLDKRCKDDSERTIVKLLMKLHSESTIQVGEHHINAEMGLPQGSVLSPLLFNVYLEEAIRSSAKLDGVRSRGDLLDFADDFLVMSNSQAEIEQIINELTALQVKWNLKLNKKKSEILTGE